MTADVVPVPSSLLQRLATVGVDVERVLRHANVARSRFESPRAHLTTREFFAFWRAIEETSGIRDVGLRLGGEISPHQYNVAFVAALHSPNLAEALEKIARYKRIVCPEDVAIDIARGEARVRFVWLLAEGPAPTSLVDGTFSGVIELARRATGKAIKPKRIELRRKRADEAMLVRHFGCEVRFSARDDVLVLHESSLAEPFMTHNAELLAVLVQGLEAALGMGATVRSIADDVRSVLGRRISGERPNVDKVAKDLGMSARTLQRRLEEAGTNYQSLLDDVRRQAARRLLASTAFDVGEVAFLLGFEELNSFTRAFRAWEGTTPARWRASATSLAASSHSRALRTPQARRNAMSR